LRKIELYGERNHKEKLKKPCVVKTKFAAKPYYSEVLMGRFKLNKILENIVKLKTIKKFNYIPGKTLY